MANSQRPSAKARLMSLTGLIAVIALLAFPALGEVSPTPQTPPPPLQPPGSTLSNRDYDPSKNVLDLVGALKEMLKELRISDKELVDSKLKGERDLSELRSKYEGQLLRGATDRLESQAKLQAEFNERYAQTEKGRVDAIRLVDKNAADVATTQALATAAGLAKTVQDTATTQSTQVSRTAEDLRKLVETTALETNRNVNQRFADVQTQFTALGTRLSALEQAGAGEASRQKFQSPRDERTDRLVEGLSQRQATASGVDQGATTTWALVGAIFVMLLTFGGLLLNMRRQLVANGKPA